MAWKQIVVLKLQDQYYLSFPTSSLLAQRGNVPPRT